jgi:hypothetical protein
MASADPIPPFPAEIDRNAFGHYLSGFTDGEGSFYLGMPTSGGPRHPAARFAIALRGDDEPILSLIRSFWQCGTIVAKNQKSAGITRLPGVCYTVMRWSDLASTVVPHFDKYPLRAKKARDFAIWKEAVAFCFRVSLKRVRGLGHRRGVVSRWSRSDLEQFVSIKNALKAARAFLPTLLPVNSHHPEIGLFDRLD